jgi:hypothetical protein
MTGETRRAGGRPSREPPRRWSPRWPRPARIAAAAAAILVAAAVAVTVILAGGAGGAHGPRTYLGLFAPPAPASYAGVTAFTAATGVRPNVVVYYSGWREPFRAAFAAAAVSHHAVPLVQLNPTGVSIAAIASGQYDGYLRSYAASVRRFGHRVILSFGHEMNGSWYSWGYQHVSPALFVAAWRRLVTIFRQQGADNVTWLWTVNIIGQRRGIASPLRWWPGASYVTWVGIDGYYLKPSWKFAPLFGPTIKAIRSLTLDPILISETAATPAAGQPAKIANLFAGVRAYGLLGFVWFDTDKSEDWRIEGPGAIAAYRRGARAVHQAGS